MKEVEWKWDYSVYVPFCPYCGEPAYEEERCFACGKPYKWVEGEHKPTEVTNGEWTAVQSTNNHIMLYKNGQYVSHAQYDEKLTEAELLGYIENHKKLIRMLKNEHSQSY